MHNAIKCWGRSMGRQAAPNFKRLSVQQAHGSVVRRKLQLAAAQQQNQFLVKTPPGLLPEQWTGSPQQQKVEPQFASLTGLLQLACWQRVVCCAFRCSYSPACTGWPRLDHYAPSTPPNKAHPLLQTFEAAEVALCNNGLCTGLRKSDGPVSSPLSPHFQPLHLSATLHLTVLLQPSK
jgi:hypothetical protein